MRVWKAVDLFAGVGSVRLGFERAFGDSLNTVYAFEPDKASVQTYKINFQDKFEVQLDASKVTTNRVPHFDICMAALPSQAFSFVGRRAGFDDERSQAFWGIVKLCEHHLPKVIFLEASKGLWGHDEGKTLHVMTSALCQLRYNVYTQVTNSRDFGVPQSRERLYLVAIRNDIAPRNFDFPEGGERVKLGDILESEIDSKYWVSQYGLDAMKSCKSKNAAKGHGFGYRVWELDGCTGAIYSSNSCRDRSLIVDHPDTEPQPKRTDINTDWVRRLTPRECARLQGFPDDFIFPGSDTATYHQVGNSVTVPVVRAIAERIKAVLEKKLK